MSDGEGKKRRRVNAEKSVAGGICGLKQMVSQSPESALSGVGQNVPWKERSAGKSNSAKGCRWDQRALPRGSVTEEHRLLDAGGNWQTAAAGAPDQPGRPWEDEYCM